MPTYLSPGVYVEEIPSGAKPIEGVATSVAAFIGSAHRGPVGEAKSINSWDDYVTDYGSIANEDDWMGLAVNSFYLNGGKAAYICRLAGDDPLTKPASSEVIGQDTTAGEAVIGIEAKSPGGWGNKIFYKISKPDPDALEFDLEIGHQEKDKFVRDELFSDLTMNDQDDNYILAQVNDNSQIVQIILKEDVSDPTTDPNQYQQGSLTGGELLLDFLGFAALAEKLSLTLNINGLGAKQITIDRSSLGDFNAVATAIEGAVSALGPDKAYAGFTCSADANPADADEIRFTLTSGDADPALPETTAPPSSSVEVYDGDGGNGDLARALGLDSTFKATIVGVAIPATTNLKVLLTDPKTLTIEIDDHGTQNLSFVAEDFDLTGSKIEDGAKVAQAIREAVQAINLNILSYSGFDCKFEKDAANDDVFRLSSGSSRSRKSFLTVSGTLADALKLTDGGAEVDPGREINHGTAKVIPVQVLGEGSFEEGVALAGGGAASPTALDYQGFFGKTLKKIRDVTLIVLPGEYWAKDGSGNLKISAAQAHCEETKSRMVFIDPPPGEELEQAAQVSGFGLPTSTYTMLYYPWVKVANPFFNLDTNPNAKETITIAPSAFAAGMMSKIDGTRGVWKAPAGVEAALTGVAGLEFTVEDGEQGKLNPLGVNCYRKLPGFGSVIWGSRTLSTKANPEWRYVPVRRTAIFIEQSIYGGIQWAVFEPNDHRLWSSLRANIGSFMNGLFRNGAFQGEKASDAYFVRCNLGDTMTQGDIDRGQVIVIVGFAPLKPAEFVIIRIQQMVGKQ